MADTFSQIYMHIVFAVKGKNSLIQPEWEERLYRYITGIVSNKGQKMLAINGTSDHIHIFVGMKPSCLVSDLVREIKKSSNEFIKDNNLSKFRSSWQEGFGVFSYSKSQIDTVVKYILNQKTHHQKKSFKTEYLEFLRKLEEGDSDHYYFDWIE